MSPETGKGNATLADHKASAVQMSFWMADVKEMVDVVCPRIGRLAP